MPNELVLAKILTPDDVYHVVYKAVDKEFVLVRPFFVKSENKTVLFITSLGDSFEEAGDKLQAYFPSVEKLTIENPIDYLNKH